MNLFRILWNKIYIPTPKDPVEPINKKAEVPSKESLLTLVKTALYGEGSLYTGTRGIAAQTLGDKGEAAKDAVPVLIEALKDESPIIRENAADALGEMGPVAVDAVLALAHVLAGNPDLAKAKDPYNDVRVSTAFALERIGPAAKEAIPYLEKAIRYDISIVSYHAKRALHKITGAEFKEKLAHVQYEKRPSLKKSWTPPEENYMLYRSPVEKLEEERLRLEFEALLNKAPISH